jgi:type IV pilus assembly protein PilO
VREAIFLLVLLAMPVAAYLFVFEPRAARRTQVTQEIMQKEAKLAQLEAATHNIADLGGEIDRLSGAIDLFEQKLPAEREVEVVLKEVWELAARQKLTPKSIRTDKPVVTNKYAELPIKITIVGDFDGLYSFMLELNKLRRITRMPKMSITKAKADTEGQVQADVILSIFFEAQEPAAGGSKL